MHLDILQSISLNGIPDKANDDRVDARGDLAWVIDGATDLGEPGLLGTQGGAAWLASTASHALAASTGATIADTCDQMFHHIAAQFEAQRTRDIQAAWELPKAAFAAAQLVGTHLDIAWAADCTVLLARGDTVHWGTAAPDTTDEAADALALGPGTGALGSLSGAVLTDRRDHRAQPDHQALSPDPARSSGATRTNSLTAQPGDDVLLMSDGFSCLIADFHRYTAATLMDAVRSRGLAALAREIRDIEQADAACTRYPRFKISDDCTAIWLKVSA